MKFCDKLKKLRLKHRMNQAQLAEAAGVSKRTIINYETDVMKPRYPRVYENLAAALHVSAAYLEDDSQDVYVPDAEAGRAEAEAVLGQVRCLFAGGTITEHDKDILMRAIQDAYWEMKEEADLMEKESAI